MPDDPTSPSHPIRILSYNLWHARAQRELGALVEAYSPDALCVQEAHGPTLPRRIGDLQLAIATPKNRLTVALYIRTSRFEVESARTSQLLTSRHDRYVGGTDHRLAAARVHDLLAGRRIVLGSFHGTPFTDSNAMRRRQVDDAHGALAQLGPGLPSVMAGDYNHPILLFMLRHHLKRQGLSVAHTATSTFHRDGNLMRGKFDLATTSRLVVTKAETLPQAASDHKPVLFTMEYTDLP